MSNNVALSNLTVNNVVIPLGGESTFAMFTPDARYETTKGLSSESFSKVPVSSGEIVVSYYAHDPCAPIIQNLISADDVAQGVGVYPGTMSNYNGEVSAWTNGRITQGPSIAIEMANGIKTITIRVTGVAQQHTAAVIGI